LKKIIQIITYSDSTALPRPEFVGPDSTWPQKLLHSLQIEFPENKFVLENRSRGGIKIKEILSLIRSDYSYFSKTKSLQTSNEYITIIILAAGIVDGSPQPITFKLKLIGKIPYVGPHFWRLLRIPLIKFRPQIQLFWKFTPTKKKRFRKSLDLIKKTLQKYNGINLIIDTPTPHSQLAHRSPGIHESIKKFNLIRKKVFEKNDAFIIIKTNDFSDDLYISSEDGHHYSNPGHEFISRLAFVEIREKLRSLQKSKN